MSDCVMEGGLRRSCEGNPDVTMVNAIINDCVEVRRLLGSRDVCRVVSRNQMSVDVEETDGRIVRYATRNQHDDFVYEAGYIRVVSP